MEPSYIIKREPAVYLKNHPRPKNPKTEAKNSIIILVAIGLCFTGIGIFIGIPLIFMALKAEAASGGWKARCPNCENDLLLYLQETEAGPVPLDCIFCQKRLIFKNHAVTVAP